MKDLSYRKVIAVVMAFLIAVTYMPQMTFAVSDVEDTASSQESTQGSTEETEEAKVIEDESTNTSTTFDLGEGEKQTVFYSQDVRFKDKDGNWVDYDPSLVAIEDNTETENQNSLDGYSYENKVGDKKQYMPVTISEETPILMENGDYAIESSRKNSSGYM